MFFASPEWLTRKCQQMAKSDTNRKNQSLFANYWNFDFWLFRFLQFSQKIINKNKRISKSLIFLKMRLTDTGEDSKLVHRWKRPKVDTLFSSLFSDASERRVWVTPSRKYSRPLLDVFACIGYSERLWESWGDLIIMYFDHF